MFRLVVISILTFLLSGMASSTAEPENKSNAREALKPFNMLVGKWNASGVPEGTAEERQKGLWSEVLEWGWKFKGDDAWLTVTFEKGKFFTKGELRHIAKKDSLELQIETTDKQKLTFQGTFNKDKELRLERIDEKSKDTQRLVFSLLHSNRIVYRYEVKSAERTFFTKLYRVGATKDGEPFVSVGFNEKECVVSGGQGTSTVMYNGKTYYVCCSGCRDAFNDEPAKYAREFEAKRAKFKATD